MPRHEVDDFARASQAGNLRLAATMEDGALAHSGARLLYSITEAFDLWRFFTFFKSASNGAGLRRGLGVGDSARPSHLRALLQWEDGP